MALEIDLEVLKSVVNKLDSSLEKISEVSNSIGKLLAVHDMRLGHLERNNDIRLDEIKDLYAKFDTHAKELLEKIDKVEQNIETKMAEQTVEHATAHKEIDKRVDVLERWRWYIMGIAVSLGYLLGHLDVLKLLK